jgi:hypothetical protein
VVEQHSVDRIAAQGLEVDHSAKRRGLGVRRIADNQSAPIDVAIAGHHIGAGAGRQNGVPEGRKLSRRARRHLGHLVRERHVGDAGLALRVTVLRPDVLSSLLAAPWPLRHLHFFQSWASPTDRIAPEMFLPLLEGKAHPDLEHLGLSDGVEEFNAELVELLLQSPLLGRLKSLGLNLAKVPDSHRERLAARGVRLVDALHGVSLGGQARAPGSMPALIPRTHLDALLADWTRR